ncbi:MAG TPA: DUF4382 domain-containing protein [Candidatus Acidoferrales bacterium]|nr:DUF4382 domain-containing protein [Candidatus Acidoferrales bacterium]
MICKVILRLKQRPIPHFLPVFLTMMVALIIISCGGNISTTLGPNMGTVLVSISDPPSCMPPNGNFAHVFITVRSVQAHTSATANDSSAGWQELAPQLVSAPMQIDLFSKPDTTCVLAQLGSASLPVGSLQQIRLLLVSNSPAAGAAVPSPNACAGNGFNCVVLDDGTIHELVLSSQDNTGLKIPSGQVLGGPIQVAAGQSVDLNIDFNACASIVHEGNGTFRLKPTLTAGVVSANISGIGGQVVDSVTKKPISGNVIVALEQPDNMGIDRIVMQAAADVQGNFRFCPLPMGTFDIVVVALDAANLPYNATAVVNVPNGTNLNAIPLFAEAGATGPAVLQGFVTANTATAGATADVSLAALQSINVSSGVTRQLTIPLQNTQATARTPAVISTGLISITDSKNCPMGSPSGANCAQYTLVVPASNPSVGLFAAGGFTFSTPASGDVLFSVDANATVPMSGGAPECTPSEIVTSTDASTPPQPLKVTPATTTDVARTDFRGCF